MGRAMVVRVLETGADGRETDATITARGADALRRLRVLLGYGLSADDALDDVLLDGANPWDDGHLDGDTLRVVVADLSEWSGWPDGNDGTVTGKVP